MKDLLAALERTSGAIARLDQALDGHPLLPAFLHRARLEAVRRQAAVDGHNIDPWHLAAILEGLRVRMDPSLRIVDRGQIVAAGRMALDHYLWLTAPDLEQNHQIRAAEHHLASASGLVETTRAVWTWLDRGHARAPMRAGLARHWKRTRRLQAPVPLTGPRALAPEAPVGPGEWEIALLDALAEEADGQRALLVTLERGWITARRTVPFQRRTSRAVLAVDVMAATPLISATTLAQLLGMSIKGASELLDRFAGAGIAVEVTHRAARRLFGLAGMAPVRDVTAPPRRPMPGRSRGRPRSPPDPVATGSPSPPPLPSRFERPPIDYAALEEAMAQLDDVVRRIKSEL